MSAFLSGILLPAIVSGLVGWAVAHFSSKISREINNTNLVADQICEKVERVIFLGSTYWIKSGNDANVENDIRFFLQDISRKIEVLSAKKSFPKIKVSVKFIEFKKIVSGGDFGSPERIESNVKIGQIISAGTELNSIVMSTKR